MGNHQTRARALSLRLCLWPVGEIGADECCGGARVAGSRYCVEHAQRSRTRGISFDEIDERNNQLLKPREGMARSQAPQENHDEELRRAMLRGRSPMRVEIVPRRMIAPAPDIIIPEPEPDPEPEAGPEPEPEMESKRAQLPAGFCPYKFGGRAVMRLVSLYCGVPETAILGPRRHKNITFARQLIMFIMCSMGDASLPTLGRFLHRDHTSVLHGRKKMAKMIGLDGGLFEAHAYAVAALRIMYARVIPAGRMDDLLARFERCPDPEISRQVYGGLALDLGVIIYLSSAFSGQPAAPSGGLIAAE